MKNNRIILIGLYFFVVFLTLIYFAIFFKSIYWISFVVIVVVTLIGYFIGNRNKK
jgi:hypothetical protein